VCGAAVLLAVGIVLLSPGAHRLVVKTSHQQASATVAGATGGAAADKPEPVVRARAVESYGRLPLSFEVNKGQTDPRVKFLSRGSGYSLFLTENEAVLSLRKPSAISHQLSAFSRSKPTGLVTQRSLSSVAALPGNLLPTTEQFKEGFAPRRGPSPDPETQTPAVLRMKLVGANERAKVTGLEELPGKSNYFIGNDPKKWRTNVPNYAKVKYANVYPGIDLVYYGNQGKLEYDFVVSPGADPRSIEFAIIADEQAGSRQKAAGSETESQSAIDNPKSSIPMPLRVAGNGDLVVGTEGGELIFHKPVIYQPHGLASGAGSSLVTRHSSLVEGRYRLDGENHIHFELGAYDRRRPVVIDPTLAYSTYLGGKNTDYGHGIAVDASGNAYVTGTTFSSNFPTTPGAFQTSFGGGEHAFVSKLNATGSALFYSTYLGGSGGDYGSGIAIDASGNAYVTGVTASSNFPTTPGAFQTTYGGGVEDAFVTELNATGSALVYSTYLGGSSTDYGNHLAVDASGSAYVTGGTWSSNFPTTPGAFQTTFVSSIDAFVSKLNASGSALLYSTYLGGVGKPYSMTEALAITVDASGNAYVTGHTDSSNFPTTPGAFQTTYGGGVEDAFVTELNATGSALVYSTYLGGSGGSGGFGIAVDASGNAYVAGGAGANFPTTPGAFQTTYGGADSFVSKLNAAGSALLYSTYLGGRGGPTNYVEAVGIGVDASGNAFVTGQTNSANFPTTPGAFQTTYSGGSADAFVSKLNAAGSALLYSTYLGGSYINVGIGIAVDASGNAYITGRAQSSKFPFPTTPGAFQTTYGGKGDAFVSKFSFGPVAFSKGGVVFFLRTVGTTSFIHHVTMTNTESVPLEITGITLAGTNSSDFVLLQNKCPSSLPAGKSCLIRVAFTPTAEGVRTAWISIADSAPDSPQLILLTGLGTFFDRVPASLSFGSQGVGTTSASETLTLTNAGPTVMTLSRIHIGGVDPGDFAIPTNTCGATLNPKASCTVSVTFTPTATGLRTGRVLIYDSAYGSPQRVSLSGNGT
jgi:hypothetical protein